MGKFLSFVLNFFFLVALGLSILTFSVENTLLQSSFHTKNLKEINFYQSIGKEVIPSLLLESGDSPMAEQIPLPKDALGEVIAQSIPASWLEGEVEKNLDNIFAYLKGKDANLAVNINLALVKEGLSQNFVRAFEAKLQELPVCSREQLMKMSESNVGSLECIPPHLKQGGLPPEFHQQISGMTANVPDRIDLSENLPPEAEDKFAGIQRGYQVFRIVMWGLMAITALLFIVLLLLNKERSLGYLKNLSIILLVGSVVSFTVQTWVSSNILQVLPALPKTEPAALNPVRDDLVSVTVSSFLGYTSNITLIFIAGSALFLLFVVVKNLLNKSSSVA
ncbi:MAG: hypothetical protein U9M98_02910 [Patescibacteria group bacterium]|nr:hypothetical protein [Patescibacteria group bacterium]